ncbi:MAG: RidA family protein [Thermoanaerobaculia bacterium]
MTERWQPVTLGNDDPGPAGAYSRAIRAGSLLFLSGHVPRDPDSGALLGDDLESQTRGVLRNIQRTLEAGGGSLGDLVAVTVYLSDIGDWDRFDTVYREILRPPYPTRTTLGASLHGVLIEISGIAVVASPR